MKKFTTLASIALVSATMVATPAMAQSNVAVVPVQEATQLVQASNVNTVEDIQLSQDIQASDLSYAFADSQNLQMQQMNGQEMVETEGAFLPLAVIIRLAARAGLTVAKFCLRHPDICFG